MDPILVLMLIQNPKLHEQSKETLFLRMYKKNVNIFGKKIELPDTFLERHEDATLNILVGSIHSVHKVNSPSPPRLTYYNVA